MCWCWPIPKRPLTLMFSGLVFSVYEDYLSAKPLEVNWQVNAGSGSHRLVLTGTCAKGLKLKRILICPVDGAALSTETEVQNVGNVAVELVLQSRLDSNPTKGLPRKKWTT